MIASRQRLNTKRRRITGEAQVTGARTQNSAKTDDRANAPINRRSFLTAGAAATAAAAAMPTPPAQGAGDNHWGREADVVGVGGGARGLPAALPARGTRRAVGVVAAQ